MCLYMFHLHALCWTGWKEEDKDKKTFPHDRHRKGQKGRMEDRKEERTETGQERRDRDRQHFLETVLLSALF